MSSSSATPILIGYLITSPPHPSSPPTSIPIDICSTSIEITFPSNDKKHSFSLAVENHSLRLKWISPTSHEEFTKAIDHKNNQLKQIREALQRSKNELEKLLTSVVNGGKGEHGLSDEEKGGVNPDLSELGAMLIEQRRLSEEIKNIESLTSIDYHCDHSVVEIELFPLQGLFISNTLIQGNKISEEIYISWMPISKNSSIIDYCRSKIIKSNEKIKYSSSVAMNAAGEIIHQWKVNDRCDAMDQYGIWYKASIIEIKERNNVLHALVKFDGWGDQDNEYIALNSGKVALGKGGLFGPEAGRKSLMRKINQGDFKICHQ